MRIIKRAVLREFWQQHPQARRGLERWYVLTEAAEWTCLGEVRCTFPHADPVQVASGRGVVAFNVGGNQYRLITAIHYNRGLVYTLMVLTHADYSADRWKEQL